MECYRKRIKNTIINQYEEDFINFVYRSNEFICLQQQKANSRKSKKNQRELFIELTTDEKIIINILREKEKVPIDEINAKSGLNSSAVAAGILSLELQNVILSLPGKLYQLA